MNTQLFSTVTGIFIGLLVAVVILLFVERNRLLERIDEEARARIEAEETAAYAQYAAERAQDDVKQAQEAALATQLKFDALMERYRYNVVQCLQAGLAAIVVKRNTD